MPHPVAVDQPRAGGLGDADTPAVDMFRHPGDVAFRRFPEAFRPVLPHQIVIAAEAAGGDDHGLRAQREVAGDFTRAAFSPLDMIRVEDPSAYAIDGGVGARQRRDTVTEPECQLSGRLRLAGAPLERLDDAGAGAPGDMKPWH